MAEEKGGKTMRAFGVLTVFLGSLWALDTVAFDGRYTRAAWQEAKFKGDAFSYEIKYMIRKARL